MSSEMQLFIQFIIMSQSKFEKVLKKYKQKYQLKKLDFVRFLKEKVELTTEQIDQFVKIAEGRGILKQKFDDQELENTMHYVAAFQASQNIYILSDATKFTKMKFKMVKEEKQKKQQPKVSLQENYKYKKVQIKNQQKDLITFKQPQQKHSIFLEQSKQQAFTINIEDINDQSYDYQRLKQEIEWDEQRERKQREQRQEEERAKRQKQEQSRAKYLKEFEKNQEKKKKNFMEDEIFRQKQQKKEKQKKASQENERQRLRQKQLDIQAEKQRLKQKELFQTSKREKQKLSQQQKQKLKEAEQKRKRQNQSEQMKRRQQERREEAGKAEIQIQRQNKIELQNQKTIQKNRKAINQQYSLANQKEKNQQKLLIAEKDSKELVNILKFEKTGQQYMNPVIKYQIKYKEKYITWRRFSQVEKLLQYLRFKYQGVVFPELPPKQGIQRSFNFFLQTKINEQFLDERKQKLKQFLNRLLSSSTIREDEILLKFLTDEYFELPNLNSNSVSYIQSIYQWKDFMFNYNELKDYTLAYYKYLSDYKKKELKTNCALEYGKLLVSIEKITTINEYKAILSQNFSKRRELLFRYKVKIREPEKTDLDIELEQMELKYKQLHSEYQNYLDLKSREGWEIELLKQKESNGGETVKKILEEHKTTTERVNKIEINLEKQIKQITKKNQTLVEKLQRLMIQWRVKIHP